MEFLSWLISLEVKVVTWKKNSYGLFDQHSSPKDRSEETVIITQDAFLLLDSEQSEHCFLTKCNPNPFTHRRKKIQISSISPFESSGWTVNSIPKNKKQQFNLWTLHEDKVISKATPLIEGDTIRFGRQVVHIRKIFVRGTEQNEQSAVVAMHFQNEVSFQSNGNNESAKCRICLSGESAECPFARGVCKCQESLSIHVDCLLMWTAKRAEKKTRNGVLIYKASNIQCEICKAKYPSTINYKGKEVPTLTVTPPEGISYLWLDLFDLENGKLNSIAIVQLKDNFIDEQIISVGRNIESDLYFKDGSVSRDHAHFLWNLGKLLLFDNSSKFGTLKLVPGKLPVSELTNKKLVMDKFMITIHFSTTRNLATLKKGGVTPKIDPFLTTPKFLEPAPIPESPPSSPEDSTLIKPESDVHGEVVDRPQLLAEEQAELPSRFVIPPLPTVIQLPEERPQALMINQPIPIAHSEIQETNRIEQITNQKETRRDNQQNTQLNSQQINQTNIQQNNHLNAIRESRRENPLSASFLDESSNQLFGFNRPQQHIIYQF